MLLFLIFCFVVVFFGVPISICVSSVVEDDREGRVLASVSG